MKFSVFTSISLFFKFDSVEFERVKLRNIAHRTRVQLENVAYKCLNSLIPQPARFMKQRKRILCEAIQYINELSSIIKENAPTTNALETDDPYADNKEVERWILVTKTDAKKSMRNRNNRYIFSTDDLNKKPDPTKFRPEDTDETSIARRSFQTWWKKTFIKPAPSILNKHYISVTYFIY